MTGQRDGDAFRKAAAKLHAGAMVVLVVFVLACPVLGWLVAGLWGAVIATVAGLLLSLAAAFMLTLLYAMSQDGA